MRPAKTEQSAFASPLNALLGTHAHVRLLRELSAGGVFQASALARQTGLTVSAVMRALLTLEAQGIIARQGSGRSQRRVTLRRGHPMAGPLIDLFEAEGRRVVAFFDRLEAGVAGLRDIRAAWLVGPLARGADRLGDPLALWVLTSAKRTAGVREHILPKLRALEAEHDLLIELRVMTRADVATLSKEERRLALGARAIAGATPQALLSPPAESSPPSHQDWDRESLRRAKAWANALVHNPGLVDAAATSVRARREVASPQERHTLDEWLHVLEHASIPMIRRLLRSNSARAKRLRQSMPFALVADDAKAHAGRKERAGSAIVSRRSRRGAAAGGVSKRQKRTRTKRSGKVDKK